MNGERVHDERGHVVPLRDYVERIFDERERQYEQRFQASQEALEQARLEVEKRLEKLNELRAEVIEDRGSYVRKDVLDQRLEPLNEFRSKAIAVGTMIVIAAGTVGAIVGAFVSWVLGG